MPGEASVPRAPRARVAPFAPRERSTWVAGLLCALVSALQIAAPAAAHLVVGTKTLRALCGEAEVVVRARISGRSEASIGDDGKRRPVVDAQILETLKGAPAGESIRFVQHGHGVAPFETGDEALVFLHSLHRSPELRALSGRDDVVWVSLQEQADSYPATEADTELIRAVRDFVAAGRLPTRAERSESLRRATLRQLASSDARVAGSAVRDLVAAEHDPVIRAADLPAIEAVLMNASTPIGVRIGVLSELERRNLLDTRVHWVRLLRTTQGSERRSVIRAAGMRPTPEVNGALVEILAADDIEAAKTAAVALGTPGNRAAVAPLGAALASDHSSLRLASIRGLGRIATPEARKLLAQAAASHPDPATRRRARAEVIVLDGARGPSSEG
jgi:hypothetical protein